MRSYDKWPCRLMFNLCNMAHFFTKIKNYILAVLLLTRSLLWKNACVKGTNLLTRRVEKARVATGVGESLPAGRWAIDESFDLISICIVYNILQKAARLLESIHWCLFLIAVTQHCNNAAVRCNINHLLQSSISIIHLFAYSIHGVHLTYFLNTLNRSLLL